MRQYEVRLQGGYKATVLAANTAAAYRQALTALRTTLRRMPRIDRAKSGYDVDDAQIAGLTPMSLGVEPVVGRIGDRQVPA